MTKTKSSGMKHSGLSLNSYLGKILLIMQNLGYITISFLGFIVFVTKCFQSDCKLIHASIVKLESFKLYLESQ